MKYMQFRYRETTMNACASTFSPYTNIYRYSPMAVRACSLSLRACLINRVFIQLTLGSSLSRQVWWSSSFFHAKIYPYFPYCCLELSGSFFSLASVGSPWNISFLLFFLGFFLPPSPLPGGNSTWKLLFELQLML